MDNISKEFIDNLFENEYFLERLSDYLSESFMSSSDYDFLREELFKIKAGY